MNFKIFLNFYKNFFFEIEKEKKMADDDIWFSYNDGMDIADMKNPIPIKYFKYTKPKKETSNKECLKKKEKINYESSIPQKWLEDEFLSENLPVPSIIKCGQFRARIDSLPVSQIPYFILAAYFFDKKNIETYLSPFLKRKLDVSLCNLDWMLTNYSKEKDIGYRISRNKQQKPISRMGTGTSGNFEPRGNSNSFELPSREYVLLNYTYTVTLNMYRRRHFGSFRRSNRCWTVDGLETTVGQLLFLMWCLEWCVYECTYLLLEKLESHKLERIEENRKDIEEFKKRGEKRPRKELVEEAPQKVLIVKL